METRRASLSTVTPLIESVNRSATSTSPQKMTISSPPSPRSSGMLSNGLPEWFPVPVRTAFSPVYTWMANSVNLKSPTINSAFLAPMEIFQPLEAIAHYKDDPYVFTLS